MAVLKEIDRLTFSNALRVFLALAAMNYCSIPILNACSKKIQGKKKHVYYISLPYTKFFLIIVSSPFSDFL